MRAQTATTEQSYFPTLQPRPFVSGLNVAELARKVNVTPAAVRYYARVGLLHPERNPENNYRCFAPADVGRIKSILKAKALGLSIGDIKGLLTAADQGEALCERVRALVDKRRKKIHSDISQLSAIKDRMETALTKWSNPSNEKPRHGELCPLIERL